MASPSTSLLARAFTLIELLIVIGLTTALFALGAVINFDGYRASLSRSERDTVLALLTRARSNAMANTYQTPWGVCYIAPNYIIFRGVTCSAGAATNEPTGASADVTVTGLSAASPIVFTQLSGTTTGGTVTITQQGRTYNLTINYEGGIE
jgi:Tfp pilus assembly protein FimT